MEGLRQYVISVVAAALICGILSGLTRGGAAREVLRLLSGIFLAFTVLYPVTRVDLGELDLSAILDPVDAGAVAERGADLAQKSLADIIREKTEAYIEDKASALHAGVKAQVTVSGGDPPLPVAVQLTGSAPPQIRRQLEAYIQKELGITRENLKWIS